MKQDLTQQKTREFGRLEFAGKALVHIVLSAINAVYGLMESGPVYLINCRMWLVSNVRDVFVDSCFEKLWP